MKGKRLNIDELRILPEGTVVSVGLGISLRDYLICKTSSGELCLKSKSGQHRLYYAEIIALDIFESTRETKFDLNEFNDMLSSFNWLSSSTHKPEIRVEREFNIAKKKELDVKPLNGNEKYKLNKARLEFLVDIALEENNEEDFIKFSSKLKKYYNKEVVI